MLKKPTAFIPIAIFLTALVLLAAFLLRPIRVVVSGQEVAHLRAPVWTVGQALHRANVTLTAADQVSPALGQPLPLDGKIEIQRSAQVYLWENGSLKALEGPAATPSALLAENGITLNAGDRLLWNGLPVDPQSPLKAPMSAAPGVITLQIARATPVRVVVNGAESAAAATGPTNAHVLWQAGARIGPGDLVSALPGALALANDVLAYQSAQPLTIQMEGQTIKARSAAETVGQALAEAGIPLQGLDYSQPAEDQPLPADGQIRVVRVREEIALAQELIPYGSNTQPDPELELDQQRVVSAGQYGVTVVRERARFEDGQEVSRAVDSDWVASEPRDQTIGYGSMIVPKTLDTPSGPIEYYRAVRVYATSYSPCRLGTGDGRCGHVTASGLPMTKGIIATSRAWFNMFRGHQVYVERYGPGIIADYGGMGSHRIDLGFDDDNFEEGAFVGWVTMYFLTPAPASVPLVLP